MGGLSAWFTAIARRNNDELDQDTRPWCDGARGFRGHYGLGNRALLRKHQLTVGSELTASLTPSTSANLASTGGTTLDTCTESAVAGKITAAGGASVTVKVAVESLAFGLCTKPVTVTELGSLEVEWTGGDNGNLYAKGFQVDVDAYDNPSNPCKYSAGTKTRLGTVTGKTGASEHAVMDVDANVTKTGGPLLCPSSARWIASYTVTSPTALNVRAS